MSLENIAIVGAGLAGATLTRRLLAAGRRVTLYEKSRGTGGRLARCGLGENHTNLGAPWFEAQTPAFRNWLREQPEVAVQTLTPVTFDGRPLPPVEAFSVMPYLSRLTRRLLKGATLNTGTRVTGLVRNGRGIGITDISGHLIAVHDAVIVTAPAPQSAALLQPADILATRAASVRTLPTWVTLVSLERSSGIANGYFCGEHPVLARAVRSQPGPGAVSNALAEIWQLEADPDWSVRHIESPSHNVTIEMLRSFSDSTRGSLNINGLRTHRWRYARHLSELADEYLWCPERRIGACGDWLRLPGCEGAWHSANALADRLLQHSGET
ncbi:MAG: hypothetical protein EP339_06770 [Gammaproteobacteria bacterium]|nr:MAG: hypothetical protein EP339_06770 [Gammaproteobacteria bacterium]